MNEKKSEKGKLAGIYSTYKGEFAKITWPGRPELIRKTVTVAIVSGMFGIVFGQFVSLVM